MALYKNVSGKLIEIKDIKIDLEKNIQKLTEDNLGEVFGYQFISTEFALNSSRIDSLAFDKENNSFVIIEYKKDRNFSVIDQGYSYLALMLNNKADFILEYNEKMKNSLKKDDVDWSQSKVLFISPSFTSYQKGAVDFKDLPIELWEIKVYSDNMVLYNELKPSGVSESIKTITKDKVINEVSKVVADYTLSDILKPEWSSTIELFEPLNEILLGLDSRIQQKITRAYIGYKIGINNIVSVHPYKSKLGIELNRVDVEDLKDPAGKVYRVSWEKFGWGKSCKIDINKPDDIEYAVYLIKQVFDKFYKN